MIGKDVKEFFEEDERREENIVEGEIPKIFVACHLLVLSHNVHDPGTRLE